MSYLLFAAKKPESDGTYVCETCNVLLEAKDAEGAYQAAEKWAQDHESSSMQFVGIEEINYIQDDRPGHGDEIAGSYSDEQNVWSRIAEFIPPKDKLNAIRFEWDDGTIPIEDLVDEPMKNKLRKVLGSEES